MMGKLKGMFGAGKKGISVLAPVKGVAKPVTEVSDPTFGEEILGKGAAILPEDNRVVSPVDGTVSQMFETGHAVSLLSEDGVEVLIHVGLDTIRLKGRHYTKHVKDGDKVKTGDLLIEFDREAIAGEGYDTITPVVVCNTGDFASVELMATGRMEELAELIAIRK